MILINNLEKKYHHEIVLQINHYHFQKGKCYLIIGHNGSGKSTLMKLIVGLLNTKQGNIICHTKSIGYVPEKHYPIEYMSVKTFLKQLCIIRKMSLNECVNKINELSILWNLPLEKQLHKLSKGNLQKVFLVQAMIHNPDLYLFDEPLSGLDDQYQSFFLEQIKLKKLQEKTIIITTHYPKYYEYYDILLHMKEGHLYEENVTIPC